MHAKSSRPLRVVHLPVYVDNAYQPLLMEALRRQGVEVINGGGGGRFLRTALFRWRADVVHFHWLHPYLIGSTRPATVLRASRLLLAVMLLKLTGQRVVWTVHNLKNHDNRQVGLEMFFTRLFGKLTDAIVVHCRYAKAAAAEAFAIGSGDHIAVIPHATYDGCYANEVTAEEARRRLGLPPEALVYLFLGRIQPYKGVLELLDAFRALPAAEARLVIAGQPADDGAAETIRTKAAGDTRVRFHAGYVPDGEVQLFLNAADAVVCPYRDVLTSSAALLAMSFGKACVAPRRGCLPETLPEEGRFLYDPSDAADLGRALSAVQARGRAGLEEMGRRNRSAASEWTWDRSAAATLEVYQKVLRSPARKRDSEPATAPYAS